MLLVPLVLLRASGVTQRTLLRRSPFAAIVIFLPVVSMPHLWVSQALPMVAMCFLAILIAKLLRLGDG